MAPFGIDIPSLASLAPGATAQTAALGTAKVSGSGWRARLTPASFRGVAFLVDQDEEEGGRRAVTHEFPGRDVPYTEDMGRSAGKYTVEAYVLGADYMTARDALLKALQAEGPGALIVPWMPERKVVCTGYRKREENKTGGMARFSLSFVEAGEAASPTGSALPGVLAETKADEAMAAIGKVLDSSILVAGVPLPVQAETLAGLQDLAASVSGVNAVARLGADVPGALALLANLAPADLAGLLPSSLVSPLFALSGSYSALTSAWSSSSSASRSTALSARSTGLLSIAAAAPVVSTPVGAGTVRSTTAANLDALAKYQRSAAVAEAARSAALVQPASKQEATALRCQVVEAIDTVLDETTGDDVATAFIQLRTATVQALAASSGQAPELATVSTSSVQPALVLGQRLVVAPGYGTDATEVEGEILARNRVRHPGFVPPGQLEVLRAV